MQQFSVKIFVENEEKQVKKRLRYLFFEVIVLILLMAYFVVAFLISDRWDMVYSVVLVTFAALVIFGVFNWISSVNYLKRVKEFKSHIEGVYAKKNA